MLHTCTRLVRRCAGPSGSRSFSSESRDWLGINSEFISMRGLGITSRPRHSRIFVAGASDEVRSSMYVLSQFPMEARVDLPEFVKGAERAAHTVLQRLYTQDSEETKTFLGQLATPESLKTLLQKPSAPVENGGTNDAQFWSSSMPWNYTWERVEEDVKSEWLTMRVQYDVTEHLLISPEGGEGIEDRPDVTKPEDLDWCIVTATPFVEKPAVLTTDAAGKEEEEKKNDANR
ncbi:hypothetical protein GQ600_22301 [Phytophthora cactorum]|nr:hypothetical protein GQ600_22301 [Phytophthora cactorum]